MAKQVRIDLVDDLDGSVATQTVPFMLDGKSYEIDLSDDNADTLRDNLAQFVDAGRRTGGRKTRATAPKALATATPPDRERSRTIRAWARENDWPISDRGRIPDEIVTAYDVAQEEAKQPKPRSRGRRKK
ncbi:histone-like nucleoid-structuring protein Lsr2 [Amycolatopsis suaedae]|uniref:Lsr2 family protein n=1 Tax=Amycolatopsis suaedae TaxID=2510978 RepID=A0A4Q7J427_9PSEU|nr:Lsr2 family protein [Amycolatopsis suaedae]RZQ62291.1 Lsr2 family protein [Amycolatopsis suaedae]